MLAHLNAIGLCNLNYYYEVVCFLITFIKRKKLR
jgi:hypothetical protein